MEPRALDTRIGLSDIVAASLESRENRLAPGSEAVRDVHEMGIACSILEAAGAEAERRPGSRIVRIGLRIGEWSGVDPDSLRFCFEALAASDGTEPIALVIEICPRRNRCPACEHVFTVSDFEIACPRCGSPKTQPAGGDELEIAYLEIEDEGTTGT